LDENSELRKETRSRFLIVLIANQNESPNLELEEIAKNEEILCFKESKMSSSYKSRVTKRIKEIQRSNPTPKFNELENTKNSHTTPKFKELLETKNSPIPKMETQFPGFISAKNLASISKTDQNQKKEKIINLTKEKKRNWKFD